jgi:hypothetical protein
LTKKYKDKLELEEAVKIRREQPLSEACPYCHTPFFGSLLSQESHFRIYPAHLSGGKPEVQELEAAPQDLVPRIKRAKKQ